MRGLRQLHVACVRHQRQEFGHRLRGDQGAAPAADQQHRAFHLARCFCKRILVLFAVARQFGNQARVPMPAPTAMAIFAQQRAQ
ncbi:hypothetical protein D9M72_609050 [compost metagenome]